MIIDELKDLGVPILTTYTLQPEKTMNSQELEIYDLVYNSNIEGLPKQFSNELTKYVALGGVTSGKKC